MEKDFAVLLIEKTKAGKIKWKQIGDKHFSSMVDSCIFFVTPKDITGDFPNFGQIDLLATEEQLKELYALVSNDVKQKEELALSKAYAALKKAEGEE